MNEINIKKMSHSGFIPKYVATSPKQKYVRQKRMTNIPGSLDLSICNRKQERNYKASTIFSILL